MELYSRSSFFSRLTLWPAKLTSRRASGRTELAAPAFPRNLWASNPGRSIQKYNWDKEDQQQDGPAGWDWQQAIGAFLLAIGLVGVGFVWGLNWGVVDLATVQILDQEP